MTETIDNLIRETRDIVKSEAAELLAGACPEDRLSEIVDGCIPIYYHDLANVLASDTSLSEPEETGLVEGVTDIWKILQTSIYERLSRAAYEAWEEVQEENS